MQFWSGKMGPNVGTKRMSFLMLNKPGFETNCVTLGKLHNLSVSPFAPLSSGVMTFPPHRVVVKVK